MKNIASEDVWLIIMNAIIAVDPNYVSQGVCSSLPTEN